MHSVVSSRFSFGEQQDPAHHLLPSTVTDATTLRRVVEGEKLDEHSLQRSRLNAVEPRRSGLRVEVVGDVGSGGEERDELVELGEHVGEPLVAERLDVVDKPSNIAGEVKQAGVADLSRLLVRQVGL